MNFNWPLASFEPHIAGVRNLADFALHSRHDAFLLFVSSVSSVGGWNKSEDVGGLALPPEDPVSDLGQSANMGYAQSKLIAECLLDRAAVASRLRCAFCRVGIVAGPVERRQGLWNPFEYIPSVSLILTDAHRYPLVGF